MVVGPPLKIHNFTCRLHNVVVGGSGESSPCNSVVSSAEQDEWSQQVDALDKLGPLNHHSQVIAGLIAALAIIILVFIYLSILYLLLYCA